MTKYFSGVEQSKRNCFFCPDIILSSVTQEVCKIHILQGCRVEDLGLIVIVMLSIEGMEISRDPKEKSKTCFILLSCMNTN